jgi:hypothetical protein
MDLQGDYQPTELTSWGDVAFADIGLTEAFENLQGAIALLRDLSRKLDGVNSKYLPEMQEEFAFEARFLAEGMWEMLARARRRTLDMVVTLEKAFPAGAGPERTAASAARKAEEDQP